MKIIYIHQYFKTPKDGGTRSYYLARAMVRAGHEVHLITSHNEDKPKIVELERIKLYYLPAKYNQEFGALKTIKAYCKFAYQSYREAGKSENVDLVYATSTPLTAGFAALLLRKLRGRKLYFRGAGHLAGSPPSIWES